MYCRPSKRKSSARPSTARWSGTARAGRRWPRRRRPAPRCRRRRRPARRRWPARRPRTCPARPAAPPIAPRRSDVDRAQDLLRGLARHVTRRPAVERAAGLPRGRRPRVHRALLERLHVVEARGGTECRREPVGGAFHRRAHRDAVRCGHLVGRQDRPAIGTDARGPGQLLHKRRRLQQRAAGAIQHVEEAVAIRVQQQAARLAMPQRVHQDRRLLRVPVPDVVRRVLEVPLQAAVRRSSARIESEYRLSPSRWRPS